ncbi:carbohydrate-binding module family 26 protein [Piromyces sp. E2]|nr:carbohydrate-binding module family 26 protein [Piromyces sp. E2]|eukprot:OUM68745.1 carbohydrate-binding module family 26 protein [Piromyces sp. E2]
MRYFKINSFLLSIFTLSYYKSSKAEEIRYHANTIENGTILHAFCWSFNTIKEKLPDIQKAGYTAIQTSPIQNCKVGNNGSRDLKNWYFHYQPISYEIGNYQLGSEDEFKSLCSAANQYGIKIIVDAVLNHMTSDWNAIDSSLRDSNLYHSNNEKITDWDDRYQVTQNPLLGLNDLNTQNLIVQQNVLNFLKHAVVDGASGFRYDAAKHIELPDDDGYGGNFWPTILNNGAEFQYGEILSDKISRDNSYAKYMRITASSYGKTLRNAIADNDFSVEKIINYNTNVSSNKLITWVESHDNFSNDDLESVWLTNDQIKLAWALLVARNSTTPLFFSRPVGGGGSNDDSRFPGKSFIGDEGDSLYKNDEIAAVNIFRNAMVGENEYLRNPNGDKTILMIERGSKGLVIINLNNKDIELNNVTNLTDGEYENQTNNNNKFYVSSGLINGTLPSRSIVVLYKKSTNSKNTNTSQISSENNNTSKSIENVTINKEKITIYFKKPNSWNNLIYSYIYSMDNNGVNEITRWPGNKMTKVENNIYEFTFDSKYENAYIIFNDNNQQSPESDKIGYIIKNNGMFSTSGYNHQHESTTTNNIASSTNKLSSNVQISSYDTSLTSNNLIYFEKPNSWNENIYAYIYSINLKIVSEITKWPGIQMNKINDTVYSIILDSFYENGYIIFTDLNQQIPESGQAGFSIKKNGLFNSNGYVRQYIN